MSAVVFCLTFPAWYPDSPFTSAISSIAGPGYLDNMPKATIATCIACFLLLISVLYNVMGQDGGMSDYMLIDTPIKRRAVQHASELQRLGRNVFDAFNGLWVYRKVILTPAAELRRGKWQVGFHSEYLGELGFRFLQIITFGRFNSREEFEYFTGLVTLKVTHELSLAELTEASAEAGSITVMNPSWRDRLGNDWRACLFPYNASQLWTFLWTSFCHVCIMACAYMLPIILIVSRYYPCWMIPSSTSFTPPGSSSNFTTDVDVHNLSTTLGDLNVMIQGHEALPTYISNLSDVPQFSTPPLPCFQ